MVRNEWSYKPNFYAFVPQAGTTLRDRIIVMSVTHYVADYWVDV